MQTYYTLGFIFSQGGSHVALLRKNRPTWQAGKLNGIGGHVEEGEDFRDAMRRETMEEVGTSLDWNSIAKLTTPEWEMVVYAAFIPFEQLVEIHCIEDEVIEIHSTGFLPDNVIPNLRYLIPFALHRYPHDFLEVQGLNGRILNAV